MAVHIPPWADPADPAALPPMSGPQQTRSGPHHQTVTRQDADDPDPYARADPIEAGFPARH